jgi:putative SOS response-associated peptidase YedK
MPVLLTSEEEWSTWLEAPVAKALKLPRPLPDAMMKVVAKGERRDEG